MISIYLKDIDKCLDVIHCFTCKLAFVETGPARFPSVTANRRIYQLHLHFRTVGKRSFLRKLFIACRSHTFPFASSESEPLRFDIHFVNYYDVCPTNALRLTRTRLFTAFNNAKILIVSRILPSPRIVPVASFYLFLQ